MDVHSLQTSLHLIETELFVAVILRPKKKKSQNVQTKTMSGREDLKVPLVLVKEMVTASY